MESILEIKNIFYKCAEKIILYSLTAPKLYPVIQQDTYSETHNPFSYVSMPSVYESPIPEIVPKYDSITDMIEGYVDMLLDTFNHTMCSGKIEYHVIDGVDSIRISTGDVYKFIHCIDITKHLGINDLYSIEGLMREVLYKVFLLYNRSVNNDDSITVEEVGSCCFCGSDCNPQSQTCGICPREIASRYMI